jgi:hypothetical protein
MTTNRTSNYGHSAAKLKDLMAQDPMTAEDHAALMRKRVQARRMVEEARDVALNKNVDIYQDCDGPP